MSAPPAAADALGTLAARLGASAGLLGKRDIADVTHALGIGGDSAVRVGDDTAAIPVPAPGTGWNLFACEAMLPSFVAALPRFAGFSAVWVNVSDVLAMGGRPTAVVDALWAPGAAAAAPVLEGMRAAAALCGVPVVGGHANLRAESLQLSAAVLGHAEHLLTSFDAAPGDALVAVLDLRGAWHDPWPFWDAASDAPAARVQGDMALLPALAASGRCRAAKDVSQGGIVGTAAMFAECSGVGITLFPERVPRPDGAPADDAALERWLCMFPSFGYLLAVRPGDVEAVRAPFLARGIAAAAIGRVDAGGELALERAGRRALVRDLAREPLTGRAPTRAPTPENAHA